MLERLFKLDALLVGVLGLVVCRILVETSCGKKMVIKDKYTEAIHIHL